jgi:cytochrome P450
MVNLILISAGQHICPGHHLALCVVKLIVIEFITNYEWEEMSRPQDMFFGLSILPNRLAELKLKKITAL